MKNDDSYIDEVKILKELAVIGVISAKKTLNQYFREWHEVYEFRKSVFGSDEGYIIFFQECVRLGICEKDSILDILTEIKPEILVKKFWSLMESTYKKSEKDVKKQFILVKEDLIN